MSKPKTHVLGLQSSGTNRPGRETACGIDSEVRPVTLVESHPTCKKCQAGVRLRGLAEKAVQHG